MTYKLLIVDDEMQSRTTLCNCFPWEQVGFELAGQASNGRLAIDFLKKNPVHVLLSDIYMPVMDGIELVKTISGWEESPITVFFSGYRDFEYARQAISYGVRFYILKPIKYEDLIQTFSTIRQELDIKYHISTDSTDTPGHDDAFLQKVHHYVLGHLQTASLKELASQLYMNPCYVSQLYKQKTGRNFSDYLCEMRMNKAAELLSSTPLRIYSVGQAVGYSNSKNFTRTFHSFFGKTPTEYRNQARENTPCNTTSGSSCR